LRAVANGGGAGDGAVPRWSGVLGLALALAAPSCDRSFYFDVPAPAQADTGPSASAERCVADADCRLAELHCDSSSGRCVECVVDEDCADHSLHRCAPESRRCVECQVSRDCAAGSICDATLNRCFRSCGDADDCLASDHGCDERRGVCIGCDRDVECQASSVSFCATDETGCVECRADSNCAAGLVCDAVFGKCVQCRDTRDCAAGTYCDPLTYACVAA
jgi:Cys-rich repeat protein